MAPGDRILVIDDDASFCEILSGSLSASGYQVETAHDGKFGIKLLEKNNIQLVLLDLNLPDMDGIQVLQKISKLKRSIPVVMISGEGTIDKAVEATRIGAFDFMEKPVDTDRVLLTIRNALERGVLEKEREQLLARIKEESVIIGESPQIYQLFSLIDKASQTNSKVLIEGENGTGKELVARAIHNNSPRAGKPFVAVNCAAIPETLIESELFGHKKGSFTGAVMDKPGRFQAAEGGTLFLDEIGDMSLMTQAKVLRALEDNTIEPVGGGIPVHVDVRVVAATNKDLQEAMNSGQFREDLYFRLNVINLKVPPLRERHRDIPVLARYFVQSFCHEHGIRMKRLSESAIHRLMEHPWPGNVRELKNFIEKCVILLEGEEIRSREIESLLKGHQRGTPATHSMMTLKQAKEAFEHDFIIEKLQTTNNNVTKTAQILGIPRTYLHKKIKQLGIRY